MENKLHVENLRISFRTSNGKVQAVRGINFDLQKGETLAIVGESGSGKSVTAKAILGILAGNAIVEDGEIIYDGKDLLKIDEDDFHKIRGDKIAMIFQDPMSSLNPIIRIGKQLTEAMILKGKARQKESKKLFNTYLAELKKAMIAAEANGNSEKAAELQLKCAQFDKFEYKHIALESEYNFAFESAEEALSDAKAIRFEMEKNAPTDISYRINRIIALCKRSIQTYVVSEKKNELLTAASALKSSVKSAKKGNYDDSISALSDIIAALEYSVQLPAPNFFCMGYYLTYSGKELPNMPIPELNDYLHRYLDENFMLDFIANAKQGLIYSDAKSLKEKREAIESLKSHKSVFAEENLNKKACYKALKEMNKEVMETVDPLCLVKDSPTYTFASGFKTELDRYFNGISKNKKEKRRFERQTAKWNRLVAKGKEPDWKVAPAALTDFDALKTIMAHQIDSLIEHYQKAISAETSRNFDAETVAVIDYLKEKASGVVLKVTKSMAKEKALRLMEEVGIPEPRKRYTQYPFEFSGGMRQRIVIAIALAANPDILICDEPTTALDVTIQSQILELINNLKRERKLSVIFITHDLGVVANMADKIAVMYAGKIVEYGTSEDIFYESAHPYTWALLSSMPDLDTNGKLDAIPGTPPNMIYPPAGDAFAARNKYAMKIDFEQEPPMFKISDTHYAATWLLHPKAPKVEPPKVITERIARMRAKKEANNGQ